MTADFKRRKKEVYPEAYNFCPFEIAMLQVIFDMRILPFRTDTILKNNIKSLYNGGFVEYEKRVEGNKVHWSAKLTEKGKGYVENVFENIPLPHYVVSFIREHA